MVKPHEKIELIYVYIMELANSEYYCGITNNLERRVKEHNEDGPGYCQKRKPAVLRYSEPKSSRGEAARREKAIKAMTPKRFYLTKLHSGLA